MPHANNKGEVSCEIVPAPNFSPKEYRRQIEWMRNSKCQATSRSCDDRVTPVSQYADALWKTSCGCVLYSSSGRLAITVPRYNRDIMVAGVHHFGRARRKTGCLAFLQ